MGMGQESYRVRTDNWRLKSYANEGNGAEECISIWNKKQVWPEGEGMFRKVQELIVWVYIVWASLVNR